MNLDFLDNLSFCKKIGIATSGGIDSMCLLHFMYKKFGNKVVAINIEHGIRGEESKRDSMFVLDYCNSNNIEILQFFVDAPKYSKQHNVGCEEGARILRYQVFDKLLKDKSVDKIATAHHMGDKAETLLLSLVRGTGTSGASATMQQNVDILRPMLNVTKEEILQYAKQNDLPFVVDSSNFDNSFNRNLIRNEIVPQLEKINSSAQKNLANFSQRICQVDEYLKKLAKIYTKIAKNCTKISTKIDDILMFYACKLANLDVNSKNVEALQKLKLAENGTTIKLKGLFATKEYDFVTIFSKEPSYKLTWKVWEKPLPKQKIVTQKLKPLYLDRSKIPQNAIIRTLQKGDIFCKFDGTKVLATDFLQERKISCRLRKNLPVLAVDNQLLVIFGVEISKALAVEKNSLCHKVILQQIDAK